MDGLDFRVVDLDTGEIIITQSVALDPEAAALHAASVALEHTTRFTLQVRDPDGLISPPDQWVTVHMTT